jgi:hypothetical protein
MFYSPLIYKKGLKLLFCQKIGDKSFIFANSNFECFTESYNKMSWIVALVLLCLIIIVPALIAWDIQKRRNKD